MIIPQGISYIKTRVPELIEDASNELPSAFRLLVQRLLDHLKEVGRQVSELEEQIQSWHRNNTVSCKLAQIPGIGPITASALGASIGNAKNFESGHASKKPQLHPWINGLVNRRNKNVAAVALANKNALMFGHCCFTIETTNRIMLAQ